MSSVRDIAKAAGVSPATVSRVLNNHPTVSEDARNRVLAVANESRYVAKVGRRSTTNIAFMYAGESSLGSPYDAALMRGMSLGMEEYGYDLMILDGRRARQPDESFTHMFLRKGVRGAVLRTDTRSASVCEVIAGEGFPCVVVGERFDNPDVSFIYGDSRESSREVIEHLIGLGHKNIAIVMNVVDDSDHSDRLEGYRQAMTDHGLSIEARHVIRTPANLEGGTQALRRAVALSDRPTALFFADPMAAVGAINEANAINMRIPEELSIVGFDDGEMRHAVYPKMTAVCQDAAAIGREAFDLLHEMLETGPGPAISRQSCLPTWLEVHGSSSPPA